MLRGVINIGLVDLGGRAATDCESQVRVLSGAPNLFISPLSVNIARATLERERSDRLTLPFQRILSWTGRRFAPVLIQPEIAAIKGSAHV